MSSIKVKGPKFDQIMPELQDELDLALEATLIGTQRALGEKNPKDTGRMASSWAISKGGRTNFVRPPDWAERGAERYEPYIYPRRIEFKSQYYIVNNVPYADIICLDYMAKVPKAQKDWYTSIVGQIENEFRRNLNEIGD